MCEIKPEDRLDNLLIKYKYSLIEEEALLNETRECNEELIKKHEEIKNRKRNIKNKIISLVLSVLLLTGVNYKATKTIDKYINNNKIETILYSTTHSIYMIALIIFIYKYSYKITILSKDLKYKIDDFKSSHIFTNSLKEEIESVINSNKELKKEFFKLYRDLSIYNFDIINEFDSLHLKEKEMNKRLERGIYGKNI